MTDNKPYSAPTIRTLGTVDELTEKTFTFEKNGSAQDVLTNAGIPGAGNPTGDIVYKP